jgi:hypothetical protein
LPLIVTVYLLQFNKKTLSLRYYFPNKRFMAYKNRLIDSEMEERLAYSGSGFPYQRKDGVNVIPISVLVLT